jgi:hydrogenase/urease accessory protein HupE
MRPLIIFLALTAAASRPAAAHPVPFTYLDVRLQPRAVDLTLVAHIIDVAHDLGIAPPERLFDRAFVERQMPAISALLGPRLHLAADGQGWTPTWRGVEILHDRQSLRFHLTYATGATPGLVTIDALLFPYDANHQTFVNVYEGSSLKWQAILDRSRTSLEYFAGTRQGVRAVVAKFLPAGIHHILIGPDHLLFLIGLLLLGGTVRQLLLIVTSFTVAHSITLSLAALSLVTPPARLVEPAIALSIVFVGADNLLVSGGRDLRAWIALVFGFIHGFGFASVLREMGLPPRALGWSLFSFNLGVEVGQLLVVAAVASLLAALRSRSEWAGRQLAVAGSVVVMAAGAFWFVQRVFFSGGSV